MAVYSVSLNFIFGTGGFALLNIFLVLDLVRTHLSMTLGCPPTTHTIIV